MSVWENNNNNNNSIDNSNSYSITDNNKIWYCITHLKTTTKKNAIKSFDVNQTKRMEWYRKIERKKGAYTCKPGMYTSTHPSHTHTHTHIYLKTPMCGLRLFLRSFWLKNNIHLHFSLSIARHCVCCFLSHLFTQTFDGPSNAHTLLSNLLCDWCDIQKKSTSHTSENEDVKMPKFLQGIYTHDGSGNDGGGGGCDGGDGGVQSISWKAKYQKSRKEIEQTKKYEFFFSHTDIMQCVSLELCEYIRNMRMYMCCVYDFTFIPQCGQY